ncbi:MAG: hypothetical protein IKQ06_03385 [Bacilli bacterium]|nr:hypothetical protein [Bacilli bacterium]
MDETIGVKGGANDRRRTMIISRNQKKKLKQYEEEREIAELEKKVKKKQFYTLIKTLPIVIGGGTIQTLHDVATGKRRDIDENELRLKEYDGDVSKYTKEEFEEKRRRKIITTPSGEKIVVYIETPIEEKKTNKQPLKHVSENIKENEDNFIPIKEETKKEKISKTTKKKETTKTTTGPKVGIGEEQVELEEFIDKELSTVDFSNLSQSAQETLGKLKSRKIVEEYEKQLKDIRYELRKVIYEYNVLVEDSEEVVLSKDAEIILDRLSEIIDKIEELKKKIKIDSLEQYDDNYVYTLIEGYLSDFHDKKLVEEIEDSPLYVMLEEKLEELDKKRGNFSKKVEDKKEKLEEREIDFEEMKKKYSSLNQLNNQLLEFQYDQNRLLKEIQERVRNSLTESERVKEEVVGMTRQSRRLLRLLSLQMFLPGPKAAKGASAAAAAYLYFMKNVIKPNTKTTRYKVIMVQDYHDQIKSSIDSINDAIRLLGKTTIQIDKMIRDIKDEFGDYIGKVPECDELLNNLKKIKREMEEKEYEMNRIKREQELELEKNDAKIKKRGEYAVNQM